MKADLHVHTCHSQDCTTSPETVISHCIRRGIECIAVTDHNRIEGARLLQAMAPFKVIVGEEIRTTRGEIIGYFLTDHIPAGLPPAQTVAQIKEQGGLVCVPHPFDRLRTSRLDPEALAEIRGSVDIIEGFNARNVYQADNKKALEYARAGGLPVSVGTDAHWPWEIGRTYMNIPEFTDAQSFLAALDSVRDAVTGSMRRSGLLVHVGTKTLKLIGKRRVDK